MTAAAAAALIVGFGRRMDTRGWVPCTSGNSSVHLASESLAVTSSGNHKGFLEPW